MRINKNRIGENFWKIHPSLGLLGEFKKFRLSDKSKGKEKSSQIMWAIFLIYDSDSEFFNLELSDKINLISKDFLNFKFSMLYHFSNS